MAGIIDQLMNLIDANQADPVTYLVFLFLFSIAASIILPIPVEVALVLNRTLFFPLKALDLGLGKAVGSVAVFYIPSGVRWIVRWLRKRRAVKWLLKVIRSVARNTGADRLRFYRWVRNRLHSLGKEQVAPAPPKWGWVRWLSKKSEDFTRRYGVLAMYFIMSVPGMLDTIPLYVFSIINKDRTLISLRNFALANFLAGVNRAFIIFAVLEILGVRLF